MDINNIRPHVTRKQANYTNHIFLFKAFYVYKNVLVLNMQTKNI